MKTGIKNSIVSLGIVGLFASFAIPAQAAYFNPAPIAQCNTQITSTLAPGSQGNQVYVLQNLLSQGGYMYAAPNGYYGPATTAGVRNFQMDNAIPATGTVGPTTLNAINERLCDSDVRGESLMNTYDSYAGYYGYASGITYVDNFDPFVKVVSPAPANPAMYDNPPTTTPSIPNVAQLPVPATVPTSYTSASGAIVPTNFTPTTVGVQSTNINYNPFTGYGYGIIPQSGILTITTPLANTVYNEGDTVNLAWTVSNFNPTGYQILLENTSSGQKKVVAQTTATNASFILTKDVLDAVCAGTCDSYNNTGSYNTGSFRIVITTPVTDIAGITSTFRAAVSPITIKRPYYGVAQVSISTSKTPVNSGETFKLYVNIPAPTYNYYNAYYYGSQYTFRIHAVCPSSVTVSIAGVPCGQTFTMPVTSTYYQQQIPATITNGTYFRQDVLFVIDAVDPTGNIAGTSNALVTVNPLPFSF